MYPRIELYLGYDRELGIKFVRNKLWSNPEVKYCIEIGCWFFNLELGLYSKSWWANKRPELFAVMKYNL